MTDWQGGPIAPIDVLYDIDGPVIFTFLSPLASMMGNWPLCAKDVYLCEALSAIETHG
jgi:hypothetical protein